MESDNLDSQNIKLPVSKTIKKYLCDKSSRETVQDFLNLVKSKGFNIPDELVEEYLHKDDIVDNTIYEPTKIYTTIGVYKNGDIKMNGVIGLNMIDHIGYNRVARPGRALFVDGICIIQGYLSDEEIKSYEELFKVNPQYTVDIDTAPYQ